MLRQWHENSMVCDSPPSLRNQIPTCWAWQLITFYYLFIDCWALSFLVKLLNPWLFEVLSMQKWIDFNSGVDRKCSWITVDICSESVTACAMPWWFCILTALGSEPRVCETLICAVQMDPPLFSSYIENKLEENKAAASFYCIPMESDWNEEMALTHWEPAI